MWSWVVSTFLHLVFYFHPWWSKLIFKKDIHITSWYPNYNTNEHPLRTPARVIDHSKWVFQAITIAHLSLLVSHVMISFIIKKRILNKKVDINSCHSSFPYLSKLEHRHVSSTCVVVKRVSLFLARYGFLIESRFLILCLPTHYKLRVTTAKIQTAIHLPYIKTAYQPQVDDVNNLGPPPIFAHNIYFENLSHPHFEVWSESPFVTSDAIIDDVDNPCQLRAARLNLYLCSLLEEACWCMNKCE